MKLIAAIACVVLLTACSSNIYPYEVKGAEYICKDKGGIALYQAHAAGGLYVLCNDGVYHQVTANSIKGVQQ